MKNLLFIIALAAVFSLGLASCNDQSKQKVYQEVEQMPEFPGGEDSLMTWLGENIKYPEEAVKNGVCGRVLLRFVVEADGSVNEVEIVRGVEKLLDTEAMRVVKAMPKWIPGKNGGENVAVSFTLPVNFTLPEADALQTADVMPAFEGGDAALMKWLGENVKYPEEAVTKKIQGRVLVRFVVDADGSVKHAKVVKGVNELLDAEALRVVNAMPKWTPGRNGDENVAVWFTLPVTFQL